jgi:MoaA/NifB/PqqE/SkfB family radical SAM enzyme
MRDDLVALITQAQANGQVTGLLTDGVRLSDASYFNQLLLTGIDHLLIILDPNNEQVWQAIQLAASSEIFTAVHITLTSKNQADIPGIIDRLAGLGINGISLSTNSVERTAEFQAARDQVAALQIELVWDLPVPYSALNPVALEVEGLDLPEGAGRAWLYVEPDGDVLPAQGFDHVLGNLLFDPWEKVWSEAKTVSRS